MKKTSNITNIIVNDITLNQFGDYAGRFLQSLADQGYAVGTINQYHGFISTLAHTMHAKGIPLRELDQLLAEDLAAQIGWKKKSGKNGLSIARRFVQFLQKQGAGKAPAPPTAKEIARAKLRSEYEVYLRCQRGLSEGTIFHCWRYADRFLDFRFGDKVGDLSQIRPPDISAFLQHLTERKKPFKINTEKTRLVRFGRPRRAKVGKGEKPETFDFLGFTHYWGKSRKGYWVVKKKTAASRFRRTLRAISEWGMKNRHLPLKEQQRKLNQKLRGHDAYYGVTGNYRMLAKLRCEVAKMWRKWLGRRNRSRAPNWEKFQAMLQVFPLAPARIVHSRTY